MRVKSAGSKDVWSEWSNSLTISEADVIKEEVNIHVCIYIYIIVIYIYIYIYTHTHIHIYIPRKLACEAYFLDDAM
jgi:hypothetical protein